VNPRHSTTPGVAVVTGAARRIGREIALALATDGWDVAVHYATAHAEALGTVADIEQLGRRAVAVGCDLADATEARALIPQCAQKLGMVGCVVNNASVFEFDEVSAFDPARLARHVAINTAAPVLLANALHAGLPAGARGVVVNLLDQKLWNPNPDFFSYTLSKSALKEATVLLAQALAPRVRVVGVAPGITLPSSLQDDAAFERTRAMAPLGQSSTAADVAAAVVYLVRAQAVTGTTLLVDGGQHLQPLGRDFSFL
jgi:NAD(P)-dependent dehydrogenase (short-subunit alcohol dehydrogenase family)